MGRPIVGIVAKGNDVHCGVLPRIVGEGSLRGVHRPIGRVECAVLDNEAGGEETRGAVEIHKRRREDGYRTAGIHSEHNGGVVDDERE